MYPANCSMAFDFLMKEAPNQDHYDSGQDGICSECRTCRFHRPFWKYQSAKTVKQKEQPSIRHKLDHEKAQSKAQHKEKVKIKAKDRGVEL